MVSGQQASVPLRPEALAQRRPEAVLSSVHEASTTGAMSHLPFYTHAKAQQDRLDVGGTRGIGFRVECSGPRLRLWDRVQDHVFCSVPGEGLMFRVSVHGLGLGVWVAGNSSFEGVESGGPKDVHRCPPIDARCTRSAFLLMPGSAHSLNRRCASKGGAFRCNADPKGRRGGAITRQHAHRYICTSVAIPALSLSTGQQNFADHSACGGHEPRNMAKSSWRDATVYKEWRWTHPDAVVVAQARVKMQEVKASVWGKKTALDWDTLTDIEHGFSVQWVEGATRKTAHQWFWQRIFAEAMPMKRSHNTRGFARGVPGLISYIRTDICL